MSDCGALGNMLGSPTNWTATETLLRALNSGLDLSTGNEFSYLDVISEALRQGLLSHDALDRALGRSLLQRFQAGAFDPAEGQPYAQVGAEAVNATAHWAFNLEAASQGLVLLRNEPRGRGRGADPDPQRDNSARSAPLDTAQPPATLPLQTGARVAVVGPHAVSRRRLFSGYYGDEVCWSPNPHDPTFACVQALGEAIAAVNAGGRTLVEPGVQVEGGDASGMPAALAAVRRSDAVVLALGTDTTDVEKEGKDRATAGLPAGHQERLALAVLAAAAEVGAPVVLVVLNGGAVALDPVLAAPAPPHAIIEGFFPGHRGAEALARHIFGLDNRWGRLPYSIMSAAFAARTPMADMRMRGRTYRYAAPADILFEFGFGLSYTAFALEAVGGFTGRCGVRTLRLRNTGTAAGDAVVLAYFRPQEPPGPSSAQLRRQLFAFQRHSLAAGGSTLVTVGVLATDLALVREDGVRGVVPGHYEVRFSVGDGAAAKEVTEVLWVAPGVPRKARTPPLQA